MTDPLIGKTLGDYTIIELLGRGGMARVYRGYDESLDRYAAVKVIDVSGNAEELKDYQARFTREARAIARLKHPNIVGVYQFGQVPESDVNFMAMQFIEGEDLRYILRKHHDNETVMATRTALRILRDTASALDHAHKEGVIHRDIKPSNIMVTPDGKAVLTDFGLALNIPEGTFGNTFGSAHYIAPEQAISSAQAVPQSDFYSLGVVMYEMLTGKVPFDDPSTMSVALKHLNDPPPLPSTVNPKIGPELENVIMHALRKEPQDRFPDGTSMIRALNEAFASQPDAASGSDEDDTAELEVIRLQQAAAQADAAAPADADKPVLKETSLSSPRPKGADTSPLRKQAGRQGSGSGLRLLVLAAVLLAIIIGGVLVIQNLSGDQATPTAAALASTEEETPATNENAAATPTARATTPAAATPEAAETTEPTGTAVPDEPTSIAAEATETEAGSAASDSPTATRTPDPNPDLTFYYDDQSFLLVNNTRGRLDVQYLVFTRTDPETGQEFIFNASDWNTQFAVSPPSALPGRNCYHVWRSGLNPEDIAIDYQDYCRVRAAWWRAARVRYFWIDDRPDATFEVTQFGDVLATCSIAAGQCSTSFP